ncbi:MAG: phosphoenolpyruvate carboxykinase (ATP), partial [Planctomycetaceae bacterium]|nr:phosphoenolpyruvate carboxykinase (ATP) [Planctomycetaceae bacterium]
GWSGGAYGTGERMSLKYTRAIIDAIHAGQLDDVATVTEPVFGLAIPENVPGCPSEILIPSSTWSDSAAYDQTATKLAQLFTDNFAQYLDQAEADVIAAGPTVSGTDS